MALVYNDFETDPISFTLIPEISIRLDTTFVKAVCGTTTNGTTLAS